MNNLEKRIFDSQPDLFALDTAIESCEKSKDGWAVTLDKTIFFPRGGGQPCDKGSINGLEVKDTYEENGKIIHILPSPAEPGAAAHCEIDADTRRGHMAHHLAQHILSAHLTAMLGNDTKSAAVTCRLGHIELPLPLTAAEISLVEKAANKTVKYAQPVKTYYLTPEEASKKAVRGKITPHEMIRLVEIEGFDINACGGTHCRNTADIGQIVITGYKEVRGLFRIYFKAGKAAQNELEGRTEALISAQSDLGCETTDELSQKAENARNTINELESQVSNLKQALFENDLERLRLSGEEAGDFLFSCFKAASSDPKHWKSVCKTYTESHKAVCFLALENENGVTVMALRSKGKEGPDMGAYIKRLAQALGGKGGGSQVDAQCLLPLCPGSLEAFGQEACQIRKELNK